MTRMICGLLLAVVFGYAGVAKAIDPQPLIGALESIVPGASSFEPLVVRAIGALVVALELAAGVSVILWSKRKAPFVVVFAMLLAFSIALVRIAYAPDAKPCGCFGQSGDDQSSDLLSGLLRNAGLMLVAVTGIAAVPRRKGRPGPVAGSSTGGLRGFSLIEVLVVIVVVSLLVALALPAMGSARDRARVVRDTVVVREVATAVASYSNDYRESFPFIADAPGDLYASFSRGEYRRTGFFQYHAWFWPSVVVPDYIASRTVVEPAVWREALLRVGTPDEVVVTGIVMSGTLCARPEYWADGDVDVWGRDSYFDAVRTHDVTFASDKGTFVFGLGAAGASAFRGSPWPAAWADGSARTVTEADLDVMPIVNRPAQGARAGILSTRDGVHGRDVPVR